MRHQDVEHELDGVLRERPQRANGHRSVHDDLRRIEAFVKGGFDRHETRGLAIFACAATDLWEVIELPKPVRSCLVINHAPAVGQLESMVQEHEPIGVLLADKQRAAALRVRARPARRPLRAHRRAPARLRQPRRARARHARPTTARSSPTSTCATRPGPPSTSGRRAASSTSPSARPTPSPASSSGPCTRTSASGCAAGSRSAVGAAAAEVLAAAEAVEAEVERRA